ncbi:MAG: AsmA family protein [Neisseriaceae bacterium]|nr:AsmA family protein [Neisseriaceae bacterium]
MSSHYFYSKKFWFWSVIVVIVAVLLLALVGQVLLNFIFDQQKVFAQIEQLFNQTPYTVSYETRLRKSWFPEPNISLYNVEIKDKQGTIFHSKRINIRFSSALLLGQKKIKKVTINYPEWHIKKNNQNNWNVAQLFSLNSNNQNIPNRIVIADGVLNIHYDQQHYRMQNIQLTGENMQEIGHIQGSGQWIKNKTNHADYAVPFQFQTLLQYKNHTLLIQDFSGNLNTSLPYFGETDVQWHLPYFRYNREKNIFTTGRTAIDGQSKNRTLSFNIQDTGWIMNHETQNLESPKTTAIFHWIDKNSEWKANIVLEKSLFDQYNYHTNMRYNLTRKTSELIHTLDATSHIKMDKNWQHIDLSNLNIQTVQSNIDNTHLLWQTNLSGNADYAVQQGIAKIYLSGTLDQQPMQMISQYHPQEEYAWQSKIALNTLNLTPHIDIANRQLPALKEVDQFLVELSKSLKYLGNKKMQADLSIDRLKLGGGQINHFSATMEIDKNQAQWKNIQAKIYGGTLQGSLKLNNAYPPTYTINQDLANIDVGNLLFDTIGYPYFSGIGNVYVDLKMKGGSNTPAGIEGDTVFIVENGLMRGLNIDDLMKNKANFSEHISHNTLGFNKNTVAPFTYFSMLTHWKNDIGETPTAIFESEMFNIDGVGTFDLNNQTLDYNFALMGKLSAQSDPIYLPLHIMGKLNDPQYTVDYNAVVRDAKNSEERQRAVQDLLKQQWNLFKQSTMN